MTELSPASHIVPSDSTAKGKAGAVGVLLPNTVAHFHRETAWGLEDDGRGELWLRGPQVMFGYHGNPQATADTFGQFADQQWLRTGDIARVDADGYFWIVDRIKELIKYKGFQVICIACSKWVCLSPLMSPGLVCPGLGPSTPVCLWLWPPNLAPLHARRENTPALSGGCNTCRCKPHRRLQLCGRPPSPNDSSPRHC